MIKEKHCVTIMVALLIVLWIPILLYNIQTMEFPQYLLFSSIQLRKTSKGISIIWKFTFSCDCAFRLHHRVYLIHLISLGEWRDIEFQYVHHFFPILLCPIEVLWHFCILLWDTTTDVLCFPFLIGFELISKTA